MTLCLAAGCKSKTRFTCRAGLKMALNNTVQLHAFVKGEFLRMSYQVLLQLFVVGDDTIVDDDKL